MQDTLNIPDSLVSKLQKLLRLGNSDNPNESDLALTKAKQLAVENGIDLAAIQLYDKTKPVEKIERQDVILESARKSITQHSVTRILQNHFNTKILYSGGRYQGVRLIFIGTKTDIEFAVYLNSYLNGEFMRRWRNYYKKTPGARLEERNSFIYGLESGLREKLNAATQTAQKDKLASYGEQATAIGNQYALMVVNHKERLEQAVKDMFPKLGKAYGGKTSRHFNDAFQSGKTEGKTINTNRALGNNSRLTLS